MNLIELQDIGLPDPSILAQSLAALERFEGVVDLNPAVGQFLVYEDHLPRGVFLVVSGELGLYKGDACLAHQDVSETDSLCLTLPVIGGLNAPAPHSARVERAGRVLYIPRSIVVSEDEVGEILDRPCFVEARVSDG